MNTITSKLREARSRLYRNRFLQVTVRVKAFDEIYKIHLLLQRSDLKHSARKSSEFVKMTPMFIHFSTFSVFRTFFEAKFQKEKKEKEKGKKFKNCRHRRNYSFSKMSNSFASLGSLLGGGRAAGAPGPPRRAGARLGDARRAAGQRLDLALPRSGQLRMGAGHGKGLLIRKTLRNFQLSLLIFSSLNRIDMV